MAGVPVVLELALHRRDEVGERRDVGQRGLVPIELRSAAAGERAHEEIVDGIEVVEDQRRVEPAAAGDGASAGVCETFGAKGLEGGVDDLVAPSARGGAALRPRPAPRFRHACFLKRIV